MNVKNVTNRGSGTWGQLLPAAAGSFCFQMVNLSFSPSLSEFYILLQSETRESESWERRRERRDGRSRRRNELREVIRKILLLPSSHLLSSLLLTRVLSASRENKRWPEQRVLPNTIQTSDQGAFQIVPGIKTVQQPKRRNKTNITFPSLHAALSSHQIFNF